MMSRAVLPFALLVACATAKPPAAGPAEIAPIALPEAQAPKPAMLAGRAATPATAEAPAFPPIYFAFDSDELTDNGRAELQEAAEALLERGDVDVRIEGHADDRGTVEYNIALGDKRAQATRDFLVRLGVDKTRLRTVSYGEEKPAVRGESESAWSLNRRSELVVESAN